METFRFFFFAVLSITFFSTAESLPQSALAENLSARLQLENTMECWQSLMELRSCTGEIVLFFLNGETVLGKSCCTAIKVIERSCWPSMLGSLGFTPEEGHVLLGYCEGEDAVTPPTPESPAPNTTPAMA